MHFNKDLIWSVLLCVLSIAIFCYSSTFGNSSTSLQLPILAKSSVYSKIWAVFLFFLSLALLVRTLKQKTSVSGLRLFTFPTVLSILALTLYIYGLNYIGFILGTVLFLTIMISYYHWLALGAEERKAAHMGKIIIRYLIVSLVMTLACYFIFGKVLYVYLPPGSLIEALIY